MKKGSLEFWSAMNAFFFQFIWKLLFFTLTSHESLPQCFYNNLQINVLMFLRWWSESFKFILQKAKLCLIRCLKVIEKASSFVHNLKDWGIKYYEIFSSSLEWNKGIQYFILWINFIDYYNFYHYLWHLAGPMADVSSLEATNLTSARLISFSFLNCSTCKKFFKERNKW